MTRNYVEMPSSEGVVEVCKDCEGEILEKLRSEVSIYVKSKKSDAKIEEVKP